MNRKNKWIGTALGLAMCIAALPGCNFSKQSSDEASNSSASDVDGAWNSKTEQQLREAIANAPANGLKPELFLKGGEKGAALTQAALKYASALANGYSDPTKLHDVYTIAHTATEVRPGLRQALQNGDVKSWLDSLPPQTDEYRALSQAHVKYLKLAESGQFKPVPDGKPINPGDRDSRMPQVVADLAAIGYVGAPQPQRQGQSASTESTLYSPSLVSEIKKLQGDFGFRQDGIIGGDTLRALNAGPGYRARELAVAMERLRWLPRNPPQTRIDVNTAAAFLDYWRDGKHVDHRKVIDGEAEKPTPQLQSPIVRLVALPTWTVPKGIGETELAPKSQQWLQDNNFVMKDGQYVQQSGPKNSLGLVKFDMPDDQAIYLHDTPAKSLFDLDDRHRSHGCVRVQNAVQFATMLAEQEGVADQFQKAMQKLGSSSQDSSNGDLQSFIKLPNPIPVRLLYQTAFWDGSQIQFRPDDYGWDDNVAKALGLVPGPAHQIHQPESSEDIGP